MEGTPIEIIYESKDNQYTQRKIKLLSVDGTQVKAYCYLRDQIRSFDQERILSAFPVKLERKYRGKSMQHQPKSS